MPPKESRSFVMQLSNVCGHLHWVLHGSQVIRQLAVNPATAVGLTLSKLFIIIGLVIMSSLLCFEPSKKQ
jgi:hypothetical protein